MLVLIYRPTGIVLGPTQSKLLEWCTLLSFSSFIPISGLQFDFKLRFSTTLCIGVLKNVIICLRARLFTAVS